jgi:hypothetical protein
MAEAETVEAADFSVGEIQKMVLNSLEGSFDAMVRHLPYLSPPGSWSCC